MFFEVFLEISIFTLKLFLVVIVCSWGFVLDSIYLKNKTKPHVFGIFLFLFFFFQNESAVA